MKNVKRRFYILHFSLLNVLNIGINICFSGEQVMEAAPLVIPLKPNTLVTAERLKQIADEVESAMNEPDPGVKTDNSVPAAPSENETLDQMVVRELLQDSKKDVKVESAELTVPIPSKSIAEGQKEVNKICFHIK